MVSGFFNGYISKDFKMFLKENNPMKTLSLKMVIGIMLATIGISLCFACNSISFAYTDNADKADQLSAGSSYTFSPGYVNAAKVKTEGVMSQIKATSTALLNQGIEYNDQKISNDITKDLQNKVAPVLQQKISGSNQSAKTTNNSNTQIEAASPLDNIKIGTGTDQRDADGNLVSETHNRMVSEVIDGQKYIYAGFAGYGFNTEGSAINDAITYAANNGGGDVIVKAGSYLESVSVYGGINLYGGYNEYGVRDVTGTPTVLTNYSMDDENWMWSLINYSGDTPTEINGFTINGNVSADWCSNLTFTNNTVNQNFNSMYGQNFTISNNIFNCNENIDILSNSIFNNNTFNVDNWASFGWFNNVSFVGNVFNGPARNDDGVRQVTFDGYNISLSNNDFMGNIEVMSWPGISSDHDYFDPGVGSAQFVVTNPSSTPNDQGAIYKVEPLASSNTNLLTTLSNPYTYDNKYGSYELYSNMSSDSTATASILESNITTSIFKGLLKNTSEGGEMDSGLVKKLVDKSIADMGLNTSITDQTRTAEMEIASKLADILKNPTDDQKKLLDVVESMMNEVAKTENTSPELQKAENDMLEAVAKVLLAQAIPDLLKEGDISGVKTIFKDLGDKKNAIMFTYQETTKPYFEAIKDLLTKNMGVITDSGIISKDMLEKELAKASPNQLEKILEKLRAKPNKTKDEEAILQIEAKYKEQYLEPGKKLLEEQMKAMLKEFAGRINTALTEKKK